MARLRLASRGSRLALAQAEAVAREVQAAWPGDGLEVTIEVVRTRGDELVDRSVAAIGKGAFVNEVRQAVLDGRADVAVHSYKDLPTDPPPGLRVAAVPMRADPRDVLISRSGKVFQYLPEGTRIGTGSGRRAGQLKRRRSDLVVEPIRGNIDTRLAKLDAGDHDAIVLAAAGLARIDRLDRVTEYFDYDLMIPAPGQGALALEIREDDAPAAARLAPLHDEHTAYAVLAERTCLRALGGGCNVPIGVHAITDGDAMAIFGIVLTPDGSRAARMRWSGPWRQADDLGETLAELLQSIGAREILSGAPIPPTVRFATRQPRDLDAPERGGAWPAR